MTTAQRTARPHTPPVDAVRRLIAEQIAPVARLRADLLSRWTPVVDAAAAEQRVRSGLPALEPAAVIDAARGRTTAYIRACDALEQAALATLAESRGASARRDRLADHLDAWLRGDRLPRAGADRASRVAASFVGSCILEAARRALPGDLPLDRWIRGCCPHCGGQPDLAIAAANGGRVLLCARCNGAWRSAASGCLGCGESRSPILARIPSPIGYRLAICNACGRYVKERDDGPEEIDPFLERALTSQLDAAAEARGLRL
jgi:formate dehydrogenase maturation protein FdhE